MTNTSPSAVSAAPLPPSMARAARGRLQPPAQAVHQECHGREPDQREQHDDGGQQQGPGHGRLPVRNELRQQAEKEHRRLRIQGVGQKALAQRASGSGHGRPTGPPRVRAPVRGPAPCRVQGADPEIEDVRPAENLHGTEQRGHGDQNRREPGDGQRGVDEESATTPSAVATPAAREARAFRATTVKSAPGSATIPAATPMKAISCASMGPPWTAVAFTMYLQSSGWAKRNA